MQIFEENLLDKVNFCKSQGYSVELECVKGSFTCNIFKDDKFVKKGKLIYQTWGEAIENAYSKLYNVLK